LLQVTKIVFLSSIENFVTEVDVIFGLKEFSEEKEKSMTLARLFLAAVINIELQSPKEIVE
jgi:hypothetical protein